MERTKTYVHIKLIKDIEKLKNNLESKAKKKGCLWENFGQKEIRELKEKYEPLFESCDTSKKVSMQDDIHRLEDWAENYTLN